MNWSLKDLYKPRKPEEIEKDTAAREKAEEYRQKLKNIGQACLNDPKFKKYKETFDSLERLTFDQVRSYKNADPIQYAMTISNMLTELNTFEALISDVTTDANKNMEKQNG